jgi:hypothetical protein
MCAGSCSSSYSGSIEQTEQHEHNSHNEQHTQNERSRLVQQRGRKNRDEQSHDRVVSGVGSGVGDQKTVSSINQQSVNEQKQKPSNKVNVQQQSSKSREDQSQNCVVSGVSSNIDRHTENEQSVNTENEQPINTVNAQPVNEQPVNEQSVSISIPVFNEQETFSKQAIFNEQTIFLKQSLQSALYNIGVLAKDKGLRRQFPFDPGGAFDFNLRFGFRVGSDKSCQKYHWGLL